MYIGARRLAGKKAEPSDLASLPLRSEKIDEMIRRVRQRAGQ